MPSRRRPRASRAQATTRGGWASTGTSADRRASIDAAPGAKAARTRQVLLDAARAVFARHGYVAATVDHIVSEAGVARGSFYTYFESKTQIFGQLSALIDKQIERNVVSFDRGPSGDPIANLETSNRNYLAVVSELADVYRLVDQVAVHDETVRSARLRSRQQHVARVEKAIRRWQARGWADPEIDARITAAALVAMQSGFAQWLYLGGASYGEDEAAATLTGIWIKACGLTPPSPSEEPPRSAG